MSETCSLFPPFGDPWPSCLLPCQLHQREIHEKGNEILPSGVQRWKLTLQVTQVHDEEDEESSTRIYEAGMEIHVADQENSWRLPSRIK